jgi:Tol biopolymer transport system component
MNRRKFMGAAPAAFLMAQGAQALAQAPKAKTKAAVNKGVFLFNRIGPKQSELYISDADGNERKLLGASVFDYHASFAPDGNSIIFTSERNGLGNADLMRCGLDGANITQVVTSPAIDDQGVISPDGTKVAFVSSRNGYRANLWVLNLKTKQLTNLTKKPGIQGDPADPDAFLRPAWSPDGKWLAFSSDRNTAWRGHDNGAGWEDTQELGVYVIRADGTGFRRVTSKPGFCLGSPKWSPDGKRVVFYEMTQEATWGARRPELIAKTDSQIVSVDVATGADRVEHTNTPGLKVFPQYLSATEIAYHRKGGQDEGLYFTSGRKPILRAIRSPHWSPDGKQVVYEKVAFRPPWEQGRKLFSWDPSWDYRYTDIFPQLSPDKTWYAISEMDGGGGLAILHPDGSGRRRIYTATRAPFNQANASPGATIPGVRPLPPLPADLNKGLPGSAYYPTWSRDSQWVAFGVGVWFQERDRGRAVVMRVKIDGTGLEALTDGSVHSAFPSFSPDGKQIVFRVWGQGETGERGLRILDLETRKIRKLTNSWDNLPEWSPAGNLISFTRKVDDVNYEVHTIHPDGTGLKQLTDSGGSNGHATWADDQGKQLLYDSGEYGWRDEAALYDNTFQPYGQMWIMNADGSNKRVITDSLWEDTTGVYLPRKLFDTLVSN